MSRGRCDEAPLRVTTRSGPSTHGKHSRTYRRSATILRCDEHMYIRRKGDKYRITSTLQRNDTVIMRESPWTDFSKIDFHFTPRQGGLSVPQRVAMEGNISSTFTAVFSCSKTCRFGVGTASFTGYLHESVLEKSVQRGCKLMITVAAPKHKTKRIHTYHHHQQRYTR